MKPKHKNGEYVRLNELGSLDDDTNNCSVIAIAAGLDISYKKSRDALETAGRVKNRGATEWVIRRALTMLERPGVWTDGHKFVESYKHSRTLTFNNAVKILDKDKKYLLVGISHMAALKYGSVVDWAEGRKMKVEYVVEV